MALTAAQLAAREGKITASFAPQLMDGDTHKIYNKWLELIGDPSWKPEDMTDNFPAFHGTVMEPHVLDWHQRTSGHALIRRGEVVQHPTRPYVCATLDAYREADQCVIDCKCPGAWMTLARVEAYYTAQMIVQRACVGAANAALLISHGGATPIELPMTIDADYESLVWQRIDAFQRCVETLTEPVELPPAPPPPPWRTIDLDRDCASLNWGAEMVGNLITWENTRDVAVEHETAKEEIKKLLPDDVGHVTFGATVIVRSRNRAVHIRRGKS